MFNRYSLVALLVVITLTIGTTRSPAANPIDQPRAAAELLPQSIVVYAEIAAPGLYLNRVMNHPLKARIESLPVYEAYTKSSEQAKVQQAIAGFEAAMGRPWQNALATLGDRGVSLAIDANKGGMALLVHSSDTDLLERFRGFLLALRQMQQGKLSAVLQGEYRGFTAYELNDDLKMVLLDDWLLITNRPELGKSVIDHYIDRTPDSLSSSPRFQDARKELAMGEKSAPALAAYLDVPAFREANMPKNLYEEKIDNPVAELLLGGVVANLRHTDYATAKLNLDKDALELQVAMPHDRDWEPPREYFFGELEHVPAPNLLNVENRLFAASAHRDLSQMWLRSGDLLTDKVNDGFAKADTQLSTFFSGRDFGDDILGSLEADVQLVAKPQDFTGVLPQPAIKLPSFAMQMEMIDPKETTPEFRRVFQSFIGFLNVIGAMEGNPQLDLGMETIGEAQIVSATYVPAHDEREKTDAPIQFNFSPTLAFVGNRLILSSTTSLARELVSLSSKRPDANSVTNTAGVLVASPLQQVLIANRSQLVANKMFEEGHDKPTAEHEIDLLLDLVGYLNQASFELDVTDQELKLNMRLILDTTGL